MRARLVVSVLVLLSSPACTPPPAAGAGVAREIAPPRVGAPARLGRGVAWQHQDGLWRARAASWAARLSDGVVTINAGPAVREELVVGPTRLWREGLELERQRAPRAGPEGALSLERDDVTEELAPRARGLEQRWRFPRPPPGRGPLHVTVPIAGEVLDEVTAEGLRFGAFRYGHATWVDATGARTELAATFRAGAIELVVPAQLLARSRYPAVLDPLIGPVFDTGGPSWGGAVGSQQTVQLAWSGTVFLAVWEDTAGNDLLATRVGPGGQVLDRPNLVITNVGGFQSGPRVVWDGANFLVVFVDSSGSSEDVRLTRVTPAGVVLDPGGRPLIATPARELSPALATNGVENLLVWNEVGTSLDVLAARFDGAGALLGAPVVVSGLGGDERTPAAAWNGATWLVVWADGRNDASDLYGARLSDAGVVLDPSGVSISSNGNSPGLPLVAWNGVDFMVVWSELRATSMDVLGARVAPGGTVLDPGGFEIAAGPLWDGSPSLTVSGSDTLVTWTDNRSGIAQVWGAEVTSAGVLRDAGAPWAPSPGVQSSPAIAASDAGLLLAWTEFLRGNTDVVGAPITPAGLGAGALPEVFSNAPNRQTVADVAHGPAGAFAVWQDLRGGSWADLYFTRLERDAGALEPGGVLIANGIVEANPVVAFGGSQYLVVWEDMTDLRGARFALDGGRLDPLAGFVVNAAANSQRAPAVAFNGSDFVVAWQDRRNGTNDQIFVARVSPAGVVLDDAGVQLAPTTADQRTPSLASMDGGVLVAWADLRAGTDIYATLLLPDAGLGAPVVEVTAEATNQVNPAIATNGAQHLVVWEDSLGGARASRLDGALAPLDGAGLTLPNAPGSAAAPAVAWDGEEFVVVWRASFGVTDIGLTRVTTAGQVLDAPAARVSDTPGDDRDPRIACEVGQCLVVWEAVNPAAPPTGRLINAAQVTPNRSPVAVGGSVTTNEGVAIAITLTGLDPDGDPLAFAVTRGPDGGALTGTPPTVLYQPTPGVTGSDELHFVVRDATRESAEAIVTINVAPAVIDAGTVDAGAVDAGAVDAGAVDAGAVDAGAVDAGAVDAGAVDAGTGTVDAGTVDAGTVDAGTVDAGTVDAGTVDAGAEDAGDSDGGQGQSDAGAADAGSDSGVVGGCGCHSAPPGLILSILGVLARRRRARTTPLP